MSQPPRPRRRHPLNSLATKWIFFVFATTFVTAAVVSWNAIGSIYEYQSRVVERSLPAALQRAAARLELVLEVGRAELEALAADGAAAADLSAHLERGGRFDGFVLVSAKGDPRHRHGSTGDWPVEALVSAPTEGWVAVPDWGIAAVAKLPSRSGAPARLVGRLSPSVLAEILTEEGRDAGGTLWLVNDSGRTLPSSHAAGRTWRGPLARLLDRSGSRVHEYTDARGRHVVGSALPLDVASWHLVVEAPFDVAYAPLLSVVTRTFSIDLCVILLFSFLAYRITTAAVRPIETLSESARRIAQGQFDLQIPEPTRHDEIGLLTRTFNDMMRRLRRYQVELETANQSLVSQNEILSQLSITDGLTGLHNHRFFQDHLTREIKRVQRSGDPLSMLLIDIDDFKSLNDRLGHAAGDELLSGMARIMGNCVREADLLARYGGEEFVVLASDTDREGAYLLAEKVRTSIAESSFILDDSMRPTRVTVSVGVAQFDGNRKKFFESADAALYRAKGEGKNCVVLDDAEFLDEDAQK